MSTERYAMAVRLKNEKKDFYLKNHFDEDMAQMGKIDIVDKWTKLMIDCFNPFPNNEENDSWVMMDEIFYMK